MEFWKQKLVNYELKLRVSYGTEGSIPKAQLRAKNWCVDQVTPKVLLMAVKFKIQIVHLSNKSSLTSSLFAEREQTIMIFFHGVPDKVVGM